MVLRMAEMSMNKVIHGAVRRDLDRFVAALSAFPAGNKGRAQQLGTAWANFDDQLTYHHEGEHETAWPALQAVGVSPELLTTMDTEHEAMATALAAARNAMGRMQETAGADDARTALASMQTLREVTVHHLDHEEAELEGVYLEKRNTPEIKAMGKQFAKAGAKRGGRFFAWVQDGATPAEQEAINGEVPAPVRAIIGGVFGRGYRKNVAPVWQP